MSSLIPWVIFDADNTLWRVEHLYDAARDEFCRFMASLGLLAEDVEDFQQRRDAQLHETYGYSACRFARSFEDTLLHFLPAAPAANVRHVRRLALDVFDSKATPNDGLELLLAALSEAGYQLGIITAGELWLQRQRLSEFHLRERFAAVEIVEAKDPHVFDEFIQRHRVDTRQSWVVGDSVRSDVLPAQSAGLRPILFNARNWSLVEGERHGLPPDVPAIESLLQMLDVPGVVESR